MFKNLSLMGFALILCGCASYTTPGGSVQLTDISDMDIQTILSLEPAMTLPVNMSVVRVQAANYRSDKVNSYGTGRYSVVTAREVETDDDFLRLANMPQVINVAPLNNLLLPNNLNSIAALREASARLRTDVLLIYTFDSVYSVGAQRFAPLNTISLGFLNNKEVNVTTTVSAALFDVRTEFLYGLSEATAQRSRNASVWSTSEVVDELRLEAERDAFQQLLTAIEGTWSNIVSQYGSNDI